MALKRLFLKNLLNFEYLKNDRYQAILGIYQAVVVLNPNQLVARYDCFLAFQYIVVCRYTYFAMSDNGGLYQALWQFLEKLSLSKVKRRLLKEHLLMIQEQKSAPCSYIFLLIFGVFALIILMEYFAVFGSEKEFN